ncbi:Gfo/Idh/MocA family protein [Paenibacillus naphthalenovorans]|uniref:Gfo/Idh/MocA family protein n=1 Tax=Paenibacillus naphthalenovorans TaxID=162209 RepID=UPI0010BB2008|nr:Gfo/Idh/MocA family oxidoreductase [Paenibacillus naphthalenovorans]GCL72390.1 gfo/Idh/MocA family oxidoreductase [Paenibacillus naphthalenovorans]
MNFAIIGCGHIAKKHAEAMENIPEANLVAVCDKIPDNMEYYKDTYKVETYTDVRELLSFSQADVVCICTPSGTHAHLAVLAAAAGKHVIVEKPMALTLEDADKIIEACKSNNVKLAVVHPNRFRPAFSELKRFINNNYFGKLSHANATLRWNRNQAYYDQAPWRGTKAMDGGVLMNQAIHNLDLLYWFMGPIEEIQAYTATRFRNIESEDVAVAVLKFRDGSLGVVEAATTIYPRNLEESFSIFGETGSAIIGGTTANWFKHLISEQLTQDEVNETVKQIELDPYGISGHQYIIADMIDAIKQNREPKISGEDGKNAIKLVIGICKAADTQKVIKWSEI